MESERNHFPWMTAECVNRRRLWREHYAREPYTMEYILEVAFRKGENMEIMSRSLLVLLYWS